MKTNIIISCISVALSICALSVVTFKHDNSIKHSKNKKAFTVYLSNDLSCSNIECDSFQMLDLHKIVIYVNGKGMNMECAGAITVESH